MWYDLIKRYYIIGLYAESDLDLFVQVSWITDEQIQEIIESKNEK